MSSQVKRPHLKEPSLEEPCLKEPIKLSQANRTRPRRQTNNPSQKDESYVCKKGKKVGRGRMMEWSGGIMGSSARVKIKK